MPRSRESGELGVLEGSERSVEPSKTPVADAGGRPDPELLAKGTRRRFSERYKLKILQEADGCRAGELGALLRREGLFSSHMGRWRRERDEGALKGLTPRPRGPKPAPANPLDAKVRELESENRSLKRKLGRAELMLDIQKKTSRLLEMALEPEREGEP